MDQHPFDKAIALKAQSDGNWLGHTSPAYANMVGPFGGITAAQLLNAVTSHPQCLGSPLSLTVNYCAGVADGPFLLIARIARTNRSTQHWVIELQQAEQVVVTATAVTAIRRDTWSGNEVERPQCPQPSEVPEQGESPVPFMRCYEQRPIAGGWPLEWDGGGDGESVSLLWARDQPPRPLDFVSLLSLSDIFFPRIFLQRRTLVPAGTVSMTVYFHADATQLVQTGTGYVLAQARAQAFRGGFFDQTGQLWNEAGVLLVTTHQIVYFKE